MGEGEKSTPKKLFLVGDGGVPPCTSSHSLFKASVILSCSVAVFINRYVLRTCVYCDAD